MESPGKLQGSPGSGTIYRVGISNTERRSKLQLVVRDRPTNFFHGFTTTPTTPSIVAPARNFRGRPAGPLSLVPPAEARSTNQMVSTTTVPQTRPCLSRRPTTHPSPVGRSRSERTKKTSHTYTHTKSVEVPFASLPTFPLSRDLPLGSLDP